MRAVIIERPGQAREVQLADPIVGHGEVLVKVAYAGICGSDLELFSGTRPQNFCRYPIVPGHEWSGVIEESCSDNPRLKRGTAVVAGGIIFCGTCANCLAGRTNLCLGGYEEIGFTRQGGFAEWVSVPERSLHPVESAIPLDQLALAEPAACVQHGVIRAAPRPGEDILIIGPGTLGLLAVVLFSLHAPRRLVMLGDDVGRNSLARDLGATHSVLSSPSACGEIREATQGGPSIVFECSGQPEGLKAALDAVRPGGRVVLASVVGGSRVGEFDTDQWIGKDLRIDAIMGATFQAFREVVAFFESGDLTTARLIRDRVPLSGFNTAVKRLGAERSAPPKILLSPQLS